MQQSSKLEGNGEGRLSSTGPCDAESETKELQHTFECDWQVSMNNLLIKQEHRQDILLPGNHHRSAYMRAAERTRLIVC